MNRLLSHGYRPTDRRDAYHFVNISTPGSLSRFVSFTVLGSVMVIRSGGLKVHFQLRQNIISN